MYLALVSRFHVLGCVSAALLLLIASACSAQAVPAQEYDIVVAGAGTGGVSAAIQAARLGSRVALLEETDWVGGQMGAAAVSTMDEGANLTPPSGLYREFLNRMGALYASRGKSVGTCYWDNASHCYEPSAIRSVLTRMIAEAHGPGLNGQLGQIDLFLEDRAIQVLSSGNTVTGVVTLKGRTLRSKVLIDATEYGDVLPLTPARYRSGRFLGSGSQHSCTQDLTYVMIIKKYPGGVPTLLWMSSPPPEYDKWAPRLRTEWQMDGNPRTLDLPVNFPNHNAYRGLPDSSNPYDYVSTQFEQITRTALNWFNDYPTGTEIFDRSRRQHVLCQAKLKTLANLYYLQHELHQYQWSVANDEGFDTLFNRNQNSCSEIPAEFKAIEANMPPAPYIRESNRLVGDYTLNGADIRREHQGAPSLFGFTDAIAVGDYPDDLHNCSSSQDFDPAIENIDNRPPGFRFGPFQVPLRSLIPEKVDGLLAAEKNISESRLANGATRLQPITMLTGQAAGALAALSVEQGIASRAVPAGQLQRVLLDAGSILARQPMPDLVTGTRPWQAAQYAVTHRWLSGFAGNHVLTRAQAALLLTEAFALNGTGPLRYEQDESEKHLKLTRQQSLLRASYSDVPLYHDFSVAVEAWHATGLVPACKRFPDRFCPDTPMHIDEFLQAVRSLYAQQHGGKSLEASRLQQEVPAASGKGDITEIQAVTILYNAGL